MNKNKFIDRDLSWLSFNERVLQEAEDGNNPLLERLKFLAIFSSNLEEFYKVRVARQRNYVSIKYNSPNKFGATPVDILHEVYKTVEKQQARFGKLYNKTITRALHEEGIELGDILKKSHAKFALQYFDSIREEVVVQRITKKTNLFLNNQTVYFFVITKKRTAYKYHLLEIDYAQFGRFFQTEIDKNDVIFQLDDILRVGLKERCFPNEFEGAYAIKISRDAELYLEDEALDADIKNKIQASLSKRETGKASRLLFDELIPYKHLNEILRKASLDTDALIPGGRYHNFYDFFGFPKIDNPSLYYEEIEPLAVKALSSNSIIDKVLSEDVFMVFPFQDYGNVVRLLGEAAVHPEVTKIQITLYRVAKESKICQHLEQAVKNGKEVIVFTELKARFDESSNIYWNERLKKAGAQVYEEINDLKVHAKVFRIEFSEKSKIPAVSHLGTGNFNEKSAEIYADFSLLTADKSINKELSHLFLFLTGNTPSLKTKTLLTSPNVLRKSVERKIDREIAIAQSGKKGYILIKLNSLEDPKLILKLYKASKAGVKVDLIIRGICCLVPGVKKQSENIRVISIVDRYLEHARCYYFLNNGDDEIYCSSADFMTRNLDRRVEVAFPVSNENHKQFLKAYLSMQLNDNVKGRILNSKLENNYRQLSKNQESISSQERTRELIVTHGL